MYGGSLTHTWKRHHTRNRVVHPGLFLKSFKFIWFAICVNLLRLTHTHPTLFDYCLESNTVCLFCVCFCENWLVQQVVADWSVQSLSFSAFKTRGELLLKGVETSEIVSMMEDSLMVLGSPDVQQDIQSIAYKVLNSGNVANFINTAFTQRP